MIGYPVHRGVRKHKIDHSRCMQRLRVSDTKLHIWEPRTPGTLRKLDHVRRVVDAEDPPVRHAASNLDGHFAVPAAYVKDVCVRREIHPLHQSEGPGELALRVLCVDRKSTRLNSSHLGI